MPMYYSTHAPMPMHLILHALPNSSVAASHLHQTESETIFDWSAVKSLSASFVSQFCSQAFKTSMSHVEPQRRPYNCSCSKVYGSC